MAYDNTNSGALFKNDDKTTDKHPDYKGSINFSGTDCWLSAWLKTSKDGKKYMSLSVTEKNANNTRGAPKSVPKREPDFDDDDSPLPF